MHNTEAVQALADLALLREQLVKNQGQLDVARQERDEFSVRGRTNTVPLPVCGGLYPCVSVYSLLLRACLYGFGENNFLPAHEHIMHTAARARIQRKCSFAAPNLTAVCTQARLEARRQSSEAERKESDQRISLLEMEILELKQQISGDEPTETPVGERKGMTKEEQVGSYTLTRSLSAAGLDRGFPNSVCAIAPSLYQKQSV